LKKLYLGGNRLASLPPEMNKLTNLQLLALSNNPQLNFAAVFSSLVALKKLETLNLAGNQLAQIPAEIANLTSLKTLILSGNKLSPEELEKVKKMLPQCDVQF